MKLMKNYSFEFNTNFIGHFFRSSGILSEFGHSVADFDDFLRDDDIGLLLVVAVHERVSLACGVENGEAP